MLKEAQQAGNPGGAIIIRDEAATMDDRCKVVALRQRFYLQQAVVVTDRTRLFAHQFHTIVLRRVMAGGNLNAAVGTQFPGGEIDLFGA